MRKLLATRSHATLAAVVAAATLAALLGVGLAQAAKQVVGQFGPGGPDTGVFGALSPRGVAVDEASGDVYVGDRTTNLVRRFDANGNPRSTFGGSGTLGGQFDRPWGVAVDQSSGPTDPFALYVVDSRGSRVQKFDASGSFVLAWGWDVVAGNAETAFEICTVASSCKKGEPNTAGTPGLGDGQFVRDFDGHPAVDPTSGAVYVPDRVQHRVQKFNSDGEFLSKFGGSGSGVGQFSGPTHVAVDSSGNVYVADVGNGRVQKCVPVAGPPETFDCSVFAAATLTGLAPNAVAVDPSDDNVYVATQAVNDQGAQEVQVVELDPLGGPVDTHGRNDGVPPPASAVALNSATGLLYVGSLGSQRVFILAPGAPTVAIRAASDITNESATLNGTVNPNGATTTYHFEYTADPETDPDPAWTAAPVPDTGAGDETDDVPVRQVVTGLKPNTEYRVRLVADGFGQPQTSLETTFTTLLPPPPVITFTGSAVAGQSAMLRGGIRAQNAPTSYRFEYGTDTGYGSQVPLLDGDAGSGSGEVRVFEVIEGLEPNTTYHFRLVAANAGGETKGPDQTFTTTSDPPARAYEMVSPLDKNGDGVLPDGTGHATMSSGSGDGVFYAAYASFAGNPGSAAPSQYRALREPSLWRTEGVTPPKDPIGTTGNQSVLMVSGDLSRSVVKTNAELTEGTPPELRALFKVYLHDIATGAYQLLSTPAVPGGAPYPEGTGTTDDPVPADADADFSHVLIETVAELTPDALRLADGDTKLYLWSDLDGSPTLTLASVLPDGSPASGSAGIGSSGRGSTFIENAISDDGSVVYFTSPVGAGDGYGSLYRRAGGATELVADGAQFRGATPDGSRVFYRRQSDDRDSRRDFDTDTTIELPFGGFSTDLGLIGFSDDGSRAYGVASQELDRAPAGAPNARHLYYWEESGAVRYVGDLDPGTGDGNILRYSGQAEVIRPRKAVAADGSGLAVVSSSQSLTPDDPGDDNGGHDQVYVYDADSDRMVCVSCPRLAAATAQGRLYTGGGGFAEFAGNMLNPNALKSEPRGNISDDGARAFFETATPLVADDTNGEVDVYLYERGRARLVSTGESSEGSFFGAASPSGDDVFFTTSERLVGWDTDDLRDVYDARVGGGMPEPPVPAEPCAGDECQGAATGRPSLLAPVSDWFRGLGDAVPGARASFSLGRLSRAARARLARGGRAVLPVRVNRGGRVSLTARAKTSKRSRIVARSSKTAPRAGTIRLPLRLSEAALRQLARGRALRVSLSVRFAGVREPKQMTLRLRRPGAGSSGSARRAAVPATEKGR